MRKGILLAAVFALSFSGLKAGDFAKGASYAGPVFGFSDYGIVLGADFEHGISRTVGLGGIAGLSLGHRRHHDDDLGMMILCQVNYHFREVKEFDLFAGGGLGVDYHPDDTDPLPVLHLGANFKVGRKTYLQIKAGYPIFIGSALNFKF
jgi:hypothetical protein